METPENKNYAKEIKLLRKVSRQSFKAYREAEKQIDNLQFESQRKELEESFLNKFFKAKNTKKNKSFAFLHCTQILSNCKGMFNSFGFDMYSDDYYFFYSKEGDFSALKEITPEEYNQALSEFKEKLIQLAVEHQPVEIRNS